MNEQNALTKRGPDDRLWYIVAQAGGMADAEITAGLLRSARIPVYLFREAINSALPLTVGLFGGVEIAVPEAYYAEALALLDAGETLDELPPGTE
jgi:hypothetical protein